MPYSAPNATSSANRVWYQQSARDVAEHWSTDLESGLLPETVQQRQEEYGPNSLEAKAGKSAIARFLAEFNQPLIYILLVAAAIALLLRDWVDAGVIFGVTILNAVIGFIQESKAESAIAALAQAVTTEATVLRGGQKQRVNSQELVPGDLVLLSSGDKVPADLRLVKVRDLQVSEAALTGESVPVQKSVKALSGEVVLGDRVNMAYAGSLVTFGQGQGVVVAIANQTETGRISQLMEHSSGLETPLTRKIDQFSKTLLYVILAIAAFTFAVVLGEGDGLAEGFKAAVALAVSAIPEGLPAVVTVTLAIGVSRMANHHAIIRKLPAVEALGSTTVICSDKTGTLTENQMTVQAIYAGGTFYSLSGIGYDAQGDILHDDQPVTLAAHPVLEQCLQVGLLCNDSHLQLQDGQWSVAGDPTEGALIVSAQKGGLQLADLDQRLPRRDTLPFESEFQYMATLHEGRDRAQSVIYVKGSVEAILSRCQAALDAQGDRQALDAEAIHQAMESLAAQGLRVLAFAQKVVASSHDSLQHEDINQGLVFLGLQGMIDPPRPEAIAAVKTCQSAGIQVKMITGDHARTAVAIARQMGLGETDLPVLTGQELAQMDDRALANAVEICSVFARVAPEQKLRLVQALQSKGEIVAMTGDGVNDAPALKQADIGVAMGITGTEVAKEAADMILTDDNFASIEAAVESGRTVYQNLLKTIGFILPVNGGEAMTILAGIVIFTTLPILPVQILWVNMVSSVALSATLAFEPTPPRIMARSPRRPSEPLLSGRLLWRILAITVFNVVAVFGVFQWVLQTTDNLDLARTMAVHTLVAAETFYLLCISQLVPSVLNYLRDSQGRSKREAIAYVPAIGVGCVVLFQIFFSQVSWMNPLFSTVPLTLGQGLICLGAGLPIVIPALLLKRFAPLG